MKKIKNFDRKSFLLNLILVLIAVLGIFVRVKCYVANPSFWHDECALAWNILHKNYFELFHQLRFLQVAPPLFLILAKGLLEIFKTGNNIFLTDMVLVSVPFCAGILSILVFYLISKEVLESKLAQIFALFLFVTNNKMIIYSCQFKQYSTDILFVLLTMLFFLKLNPEKISKKGLILSGIFSFLCIWFSFVTVFFWVSGFIWILCKRKGLNHFFSLVTPFIISCFLYAKAYVFSNYSLNSAGMIGYWNTFFINKDFSNFWALFCHNISFFFFPIKFDIYVICLIIAGIFAFLIKGKRNFLFISALSFLFLIACAIFKYYPFAERLILFLIPIFIIFISKLFDFIDSKRKFVSFLIILICTVIVASQGIFFTNFALKEQFSKNSGAKEALAFLTKNLKKTDKIVVFEKTNSEYFYYSSFYKVKNETKYILQRKESKEWKSYLELPRGNYWIYSPDIIFTQKLLQTKKVKIYYQKMNSAVCYVKK